MMTGEKEEEGVIPDQLTRILYIWRLYGIAPATLRSSEVPPYHSCVTSSRKYAIMSFILINSLISTYVICMIYNTFLISNMKEIRVRTGLSFIIHMIHIGLCSGIMYRYSFVNYNKIKVFIKYINIIHKLHVKMHSNFTNVRIKHANLLVGGLLLVISIIGSIYAYDLIKDMIVNNKDLTVVLKHLIYFIWHQFAMLVQFRFTFVVCLINSTIDVLSDRLQELPFNNMLYNTPNRETINTAHVPVRCLSQIYISIFKLLKKIEKHDGILILCLFTYKLIDIMDALSLILSSFMAEGNFTISFLTHNMLEITWIVIRGYMIMIFIDSCHQIQVKLQTLQTTMSRLLCASNLKLRRELCTFSDRLLINNIPVIYPLGMCAFTRHQLVVVSSALFTFMVITIQFRIQDQIDK